MGGGGGGRHPRTPLATPLENKVSHLYARVVVKTSNLMISRHRCGCRLPQKYVLKREQYVTFFPLLSNDIVVLRCPL